MTEQSNENRKKHRNRRRMKNRKKKEMMNRKKAQRKLQEEVGGVKDNEAAESASASASDHQNDATPPPPSSNVETKLIYQPKNGPKFSLPLKIPFVSIPPISGLSTNMQTVELDAAVDSTTPTPTGGYKQFATEYPQLCDSSEKMTRLPQSLSQPCLMNPKGDGITMITPNVYLGSEKDSMDEKTLKALDITTVINLSVTCEKSVCIKEDKNFMRIPVNDSYQEKLSPFFSEAYEFLEKCRMSGRKCLIHCLAGISRSPTLCISYIMRHHRVGSEEAYRYVKDRRPSISPNFNFMGQLLEYENQLINENVLGLDQASRPYHRIDKLSTMHTAKCRTVADLCPPKVPKSASSHCVFTPNLTQTLNKIGDASPTTSDSEEPSNQLNENGKRGMTLELPMRPRALGLPSRVMSVGQDLPSPSTELSRLSFDGVDGAMNCRKDDNRLAYSNPCFLSPVQPTREISLPLGNVMENPLYYQQQKKSDCETSGSQTAPVSTSKSMGFMLRAKKFVGHKIVGSRTSRPECLRSAGLMIPPSMISGQLLATTEEDDAESPESGVVIESCPDDDSISISSGSSLEITCQ